MTKLYQLTIHEAGELLHQHKISSVELTRAHLDRIRDVDDKVKAFTLVTDDLALHQAREADQRLKSGAAVSAHRYSPGNQGLNLHKRDPYYLWL